MKYILMPPPDEARRRKGRRRLMAGGIAALLPQSALLGGGGLSWLNEVVGPGGMGMADQLFRAMMLAVTGIGLPTVAVVCGLHFMRLGGNRVLGIAMMVAGPLVSVLAILSGGLA